MKNRDKYGYLFIAPFLLVFTVFGIYPILLTFYMTFTSYKGLGPMKIEGIANWTTVIADKYFWSACVNTWRLWGVNIVIQLGLALLLVIIFSDMVWNIKGLGFFRTMYYLPNLITLASVSMLFKIFLDWKHGAFNQILISSGLIAKDINWLGTPMLASVWISIIQAWMWFGNSFIILMAGVMGISKDYFEAAKVDGASRSQTFFKITMPLLRPIMLYVAITSLIGGMQIFELPFLITDGLGAPNGKLNTMVMYLYNMAFKYKRFGYASTVAYMIFGLTLIFSVLSYFLINRGNKGGAKNVK